MPTYRYTAKDLGGKVSKGKMDAIDETDLYQKLQAKSLVLVLGEELNEDEIADYKLKLPEVSEFARSIANMVGAGLTVVKALSIMMESDIKPQLKIVYEQVYRNIHNGMTLSEAMRLCGKAFPRLFVDMIASGEASGQLESTAQKMAAHYDKENRLNSKIKSAMTYPVILAITTFGVVIIIFTMVLPTFFDLFSDMELPPITQLMLFLSQSFTKYWAFIISGILALFLALRLALSRPKIRLEFDRLKLSIPVVGKLLKTIYTARFSRGMSSLYSSGLPLINTLTICSTLVGNTFIEAQFPPVIQDVRNGESLSASIKKIFGFDKKLASIIYVGEESGRLVTMLDSVAENYDFEADAATTRMVALLEPLMIVFMAIIIGSIMLSVMLPIINLYQNVH